MARSSFSVICTMLVPLKMTSPPVIWAGGFSSWAMANSSVDLPQPDSPTTPRNSPGMSSKLTWSTALAGSPRVRESTLISRTARIGSATLPPDRAQRRVSYLVERVVQQGQRAAEQGDAEAGCHCPQRRARLQRLVVLRPEEHGSPAHRVRIAEADELQPGGGQHGVYRRAKEVRDDQRGHRRDDLEDDDPPLPLAADPRRGKEVPAAQRQGLRPELPRPVGPAG